MGDWIKGAKLKKAITKEGGFAADAAGDLPFLLSVDREVFFVPPQIDAPRSARVRALEERAKGDYLVHFDGIDTRQMAERLVSCFCLLRRSDQDEALLRESGAGLEGWKVFDEKLGLIGEVLECLPSPAQPLLRVGRPGGKECLVPLAQELVCSFDEDALSIEMSLPAGLLDL